ncbi:MAG: type II secretion system GspH family protein [Candidatus Marinimicrobia bacterium]|nr:type II secretion system GspH family protein [Candidatus Neomarinimicrobiota bacterium]
MFNATQTSSYQHPVIPRLNRRAVNLGRGRREAGMTLIEVLVGMLIIAIASVGLMLGITYGRAMLRNTMIADRALQELSNYMELWRGRVHAGMIGVTELGGGPVHGEEVVLYNPDEDPDHAVKGRIFREPIQEKGNTEFNQDNFPYLTLEAFIVWERPSEDGGFSDTLRLRTAVIPWK